MTINLTPTQKHTAKTNNKLKNTGGAHQKATTFSSSLRVKGIITGIWSSPSWWCQLCLFTCRKAGIYGITPIVIGGSCCKVCTFCFACNKGSSFHTVREIPGSRSLKNGTLHSDATHIRSPWSRGMVRRAYGNGVPLLGVPGFSIYARFLKGLIFDLKRVYHKKFPSLKLTAKSIWKWMVGRPLIYTLENDRMSPEEGTILRGNYKHLPTFQGCHVSFPGRYIPSTSQ